MNCTRFDEAVEEIQRVVSTDGRVVAVAAIFFVSALLLFAGERLVRGLSALLGGLAGGGATFLLVDTRCEIRLGTAAVAALACSLIALCVFKSGLFVLGAAAFGGVAHVLYDVLPLDDVSHPFTLFERGGWYYVAVGASGLVGALVSQLQRTWFVRIATSMLGGSGLSVGVYLLEPDLHPFLLLALTLASTLALTAVPRGWGTGVICC